ncbi:hypothetical protein P154DRAFT_571343 [Amniculicola lignicola CBS 123094]|uniref:Uncharacterized protein n=1 Tax=Amniculicola lignicola CBS 123094 TaxID=1392246 RepID=A0A6A5WVH2_9PLEO|nr:hypothetical protein P154DRAFT_571343 [Amniculicola lignicola CBS 123094]
MNSRYQTKPFATMANPNVGDFQFDIIFIRQCALSNYRARGRGDENITWGTHIPWGPSEPLELTSQADEYLRALRENPKIIPTTPSQFFRRRLSDGTLLPLELSDVQTDHSFGLLPAKFTLGAPNFSRKLPAPAVRVHSGAGSIGSVTNEAASLDTEYANSEVAETMTLETEAEVSSEQKAIDIANLEEVLTAKGPEKNNLECKLRRAVSAIKGTNRKWAGKILKRLKSLQAMSWEPTRRSLRRR